jgi:probable HAF family extracellular repeat protein
MRVRFVCIALLILWAGFVPQAWAGFISLQVGTGNTAAVGINNQGDIVGYFANGPGQYDGFLYHDSVYSTFSVPGAVYTFPQGINDNGDIVGRYSNDGTSYYGFLLPHGGSPQTLNLGLDTMVMGINNSGQYVGEVGRGAATTGFYWDGALLQTFQLDGQQTSLTGINNNGVIVGQYYVPSWTGAVRLSDGTWVYPVPRPHPENGYGPLNAINDNDIAVGTYSDGTYYHGYYYDGGGNTYSVFPDYPGSATTWPLGINNNGYVVGYYQYQDGSYYGFEYVPEPSGLLLMAGGALVLLIRRLKQ